MKNYIYREVGGKELNLTFIEPIKKVYDKAPLYFIIPGGGWHYATKESMLEFSKISVEKLSNAGFATVSIDYRTAQDGVNMSDIVSDCEAALSFVVDNAEKFNIDADRIALSGHSAGAQLALVLAYKIADKIPHCKVKSVAALSPITVLYRDDTHNLGDIVDVFKNSDKYEEMKKYSPYDCVTRNSPPTILCAGTADKFVFSKSSELLFDKLKANGVKCKLVLSNGGGHCYERIISETEPSVSADEMQRIITDFIIENMYGEKGKSMMIKIIEKTKVICSNRDSIHNTFAWPTVARLQDGTLAMVASGFRMRHVCPFGKSVICYSHDNGRTWSRPTVLTDTLLDDRDTGILPYGKRNVIVTSFTDSTDFQRYAVEWVEKNQKVDLQQELYNKYISAYLDATDTLSPDEKYLGSGYIISHDGGYTFGERHMCEISSPHGPTVLNDGRVIYVGTVWNKYIAKTAWKENNYSQIKCYILNENEEFEYLSEIKFKEGNEKFSEFCEPYAIVLPNGKLIVHIRVQVDYENDSAMCIYQCESYDDGRSFTEPHKILEPGEGAPSHILRCNDGTLIATYGHRIKPYSIKTMISRDDGETWKTGLTVCKTPNEDARDLGYPSSVELPDGTILTIFYAHDKERVHTEIMQVIWKLEE